MSKFQNYQKTKGFIAAIRVKDTIKQVNEQGIITHTPDRAQLWAAQTPQGFEVELLKQCHTRGRQAYVFFSTGFERLLERIATHHRQSGSTDCGF